MKTVLIKSITAGGLSLLIAACNSSSGSGNSTSGGTTTNLTLPEYVSILKYTPPGSPLQLQSSNAPQQSLTLQSPTTIDSISIAFYEFSGNGNCDSEVSNVITLNGSVTLPAGTYTSSDQSNYALCSKFPGDGCSNEWGNNQGVQFTYYYNDTESIQGNCSVQVAPYNDADGNAINLISNSNHEACTNFNDCGFDASYIDTIPSGS